MQTDKPLISILLAIYQPRMDWLKIQLESLNAQTYPNLRLYIRDDCSPTVPFDDIRALVGRCITAFPCSIERNEVNLGSTGTFELLTAQAEGEYFAYCDQDDEWLPEKLAALQQAMAAQDAQIVCSDMFVIDEDGKTVADSITKVHRRHVFKSGEGLAPQLLAHNWVTGCAMLLRADTAKAALPFCPYMYHDHYLALCCARRGKVVCLPQPLTKYRRHGTNQTPNFTGVHDRESYTQIRIRTFRKSLQWLSERFADDAQLAEPLRQVSCWAEARERSMTRRGGGATVWKYRRFGKAVSLFEIVMPCLPNCFLRLAIKMVRKNII